MNTYVWVFPLAASLKPLYIFLQFYFKTANKNSIWWYLILSGKTINKLIFHEAKYLQYMYIPQKHKVHIFVVILRPTSKCCWNFFRLLYKQTVDSCVPSHKYKPGLFVGYLYGDCPGLATSMSIFSRESGTSVFD